MFHRHMFVIPVSLFVLAATAIPAGGSLAQAPQVKPKKVWTNEDLDHLRGRAAVSVVGAPPTKNVEDAGTKTQRPPDGKKAESYRKQLAPLRAEIAQIHAEIRRMKEFLDGKHTGEGALEVNRFSVPLNPSDQIRQLEKRKKEVEGKIEALLDQARRDGVAPGDLE